MAINDSHIMEMIRQKLGFNDAFDGTSIKRHMDMVQIRYEQGVDGICPPPWFLFDPESTAALVAHDRTVVLPEGFIEFDEDWPLQLWNDDDVVTAVLERRPYDELIRTQYFAADGTTILEGPPQFWDINADLIHLFPQPAEVTTLNIPCYKSSTQLSTVNSSTIPQPKWYTVFGPLIIAETALSICRANRDFDGIRLCEMELGSFLPQQGVLPGLRTAYYNKVTSYKLKLRDIYVGSNE